MDLFGYSVAGVETCLEVPSLRLVLDLGRCSPSAVMLPLALLSHGHLDHMGAIALHAARRALMHLGESVYVVPRAVAEDVERLFNAAGALDGQVIPRKVVPLSPGESYAIGKGRFVRPFETFHRVPSQGYTVWERRQRLLAEFRGRSGQELGELRRAGVQIDESHEVPLLSFTGDTRVEALERTPELALTETLIVEASFLDERVSVEEARSMGHIHLDELVARAELLTQPAVVLTHFSARYTLSEIETLVQRRALAALGERVRVLRDGTPRAVSA